MKPLEQHCILSIEISLKKVITALLFLLSTASLSFLHANEIIGTDFEGKDVLSFNNFKSRYLPGACYSMASFIQPKGLLIFDPSLPKTSSEEVYNLLHIAYKEKLPIVIGGVGSLYEFSTVYKSILEKFLINLHLMRNIRIQFDYFSFERNAEKINHKIIDELKNNRAILLLVDDNNSGNINHAILVLGAKIKDHNEIIFVIYDPNKGIKAGLEFKEGKYFLYNNSTIIVLAPIDLERYERFYRYDALFSRIQKFRHQPISGVGEIQDKGEYIGRKTRYEVLFNGKSLFPIISTKYNLKEWIGKKVSFYGSYIFTSDSLHPERENGRVVLDITELHEEDF